MHSSSNHYFLEVLERIPKSSRLSYLVFFPLQLSSHPVLFHLNLVNHFLSFSFKVKLNLCFNINFKLWKLEFQLSVWWSPWRLVLSLVAKFVVSGVILLTECELQGKQMLHFSDRCWTYKHKCIIQSQSLSLLDTFHIQVDQHLGAWNVGSSGIWLSKPVMCTASH